ncbi:unnamed protein product [Dovyalis caffra]|uniref:Uncharacterized protein n=1 Tax=Dovyalis caffra TaxID=77055 RepID=A0AAV1RHQ1_9ROSI|nr:unnamed protein product [Dovyalis caffra]
MAPARKSPVRESTTKLQAMVLFLGFFLIVPLLARPIDLSKKFMASSPSTRTKHSTTEIHPQESKYTPPSSTTADAAAMTSRTTTTVPTTPAGSASDQRFKAAAHEVHNERTLRKNWRMPLFAANTRYSLVKGERIVRSVFTARLRGFE